MYELIPPFFNKRIYQLTGEDKFKSWIQQVLLAVRGLNLEDYFFSTLVVLRVIDDNEGNKSVNFKFTKFSQQDSSPAYWLLASI